MDKSRGITLAALLAGLLGLILLAAATFAVARERQTAATVADYAKLEAEAAKLGGTPLASAAEEVLKPVREALAQGNLETVRSELSGAQDKVWRLQSEATPQQSGPSGLQGSEADELKTLRASAALFASDPELQALYTKIVESLPSVPEPQRPKLIQTLDEASKAALTKDFAKARQLLAPFNQAQAPVMGPITLSPEAKALMAKDAKFKKMVELLQARLADRTHPPTNPQALAQALPALREAVKKGDATAARSVLSRALKALDEVPAGGARRPMMPGQPGQPQRMPQGARPPQELGKVFGEFNQLIGQLGQTGQPMDQWIQRRNAILAKLGQQKFGEALSMAKQANTAMKAALAKGPKPTGKPVSPPPTGITPPAGVQPTEPAPSAPLDLLVKRLDEVRALPAEDYNQHKPEIAAELLALARGQMGPGQPGGMAPSEELKAPEPVKQVLLKTEIKAEKCTGLLDKPVFLSNAYTTTTAGVIFELAGLPASVAKPSLELRWRSGDHEGSFKLEGEAKEGKAQLVLPDRLPGQDWPGELLQVSAPAELAGAELSLVRLAAPAVPIGDLLRQAPLPLRIFDFLRRIVIPGEQPTVASGLTRDQRHPCESGTSSLLKARVGQSLLALSQLLAGKLPEAEAKQIATMATGLLVTAPGQPASFGELVNLAEARLDASRLPGASPELVQLAEKSADEVRDQVRRSPEAVLAAPTSTLAVAARVLLLSDTEAPSEEAQSLLGELRGRLEASTGLVKEFSRGNPVYTTFGQASTARAFELAESKQPGTTNEAAHKLLQATFNSPLLADARFGGFFQRAGAKPARKSLLDHAELLLAVRGLEAGGLKNEQLAKWGADLSALLTDKFYDPVWNGAAAVTDEQFRPVGDSPCATANTEAMCGLLIGLVQF